jgi:hypothetical protein
VADPVTKTTFLWMMAAVREGQDRVFTQVTVQPEFEGRFKKIQITFQARWAIESSIYSAFGNKKIGAIYESPLFLSRLGRESALSL